MSSLRTVDLPAPLGPMMPSASPGPSVKLTSRTAQNSPPPSAPSAGRARKARETSAGIKSRKRLCISPVRNFFQTAGELDLSD